ncbi:MAG: hypothetical protein ACLQSR_16930 [Limisphaerales bacterium]
MKTENKIKSTPFIARRRNLFALTTVASLTLATATTTVLADEGSGAAATGNPDAIRPFQVHFSDEALADLRQRIAAIRAGFKPLHGARITAENK